MAVGDLEGKIGEVNGQLRVLTPILEALGKKVEGVGERLARHEENLKQVWNEIRALKAVDKSSSNRFWEIGKAVISAVIGAVVAYVVAKLTKGGP